MPAKKTEDGTTYSCQNDVNTFTVFIGYEAVKVSVVRQSNGRTRVTFLGHPKLRVIRDPKRTYNWKQGCDSSKEPK